MIKNFLFLMLIVLCVFGFFKLKAITENKYINIKFEDFEPISKNVPVYIKGVKIGKVYKVGLSKSIDYTLVRLEIYKKYKIPTNTKAKLKYDRLSKEYINLVPPEKPYIGYLKNNDVIEGTAVKNLRKVLEEHIEKGNVDNIVSQANDGLENITQAADKINQAADLIVGIIKDNRPEIDRIIANFADASEDTGVMISELRQAFKDPQVRGDIKDMAKNLASTAKNIKETTSNPKINQSINNVYDMTTNLKSSSDKIDFLMCKGTKTLDNANTTMKNADVTMESITHTSEGFSDMMSKRFLFFRFMFGKPGASMER